jgi:hypothetical protein
MNKTLFIFQVLLGLAWCGCGSQCDPKQPYAIEIFPRTSPRSVNMCRELWAIHNLCYEKLKDSLYLSQLKKDIELAVLKSFDTIPERMFCDGNSVTFEIYRASRYIKGFKSNWQPEKDYYNEDNDGIIIAVVRTSLPEDKAKELKINTEGILLQYSETRSYIFREYHVPKSLYLHVFTDTFYSWKEIDKICGR